jgi:hypothetical protein
MIEKSRHKDLIEIIAVDDGSIDSERIDDFPNLIDLDIKVIRIEPKDKTWVNPCVPFNIGFNHVNTDIIIIQNPECIHFGDVIGYTLDNIKENVYLNFGCYSIDKNYTDKINKMNLNNNSIGKLLFPLRKNGVLADGTTGWYNHSKYRPHKLHFCSSIMRKDLMEIGGFDERYKDGIGYDDNDFLRRIERKGMEIKMIDNPFVIHQYHGNTNYSNKELVKKNYDLYVKLS